MSKMFYGVWVYSILCLILVLLYGYYAEIFYIELFDYSLSFWFALIVNLVLLSTAIISLKGPKILPILGIILMPISIYLFYTSWVEKTSLYLTGFMLIPIALLLISTIMRRRQKYPVTEQ